MNTPRNSSAEQLPQPTFAPSPEAQGRTEVERSHSNELIELGPYPDPYITKTPSGDYVFIFVDETKQNIYIKQAEDLVDLPSTPSRLLWHHPSTFTEIWAPELHFEGNQKFIHYSADRGDNRVYRSYVTAGTIDAPLDAFESHAEIELPGDTFAIDLTPVKINDSQYYVWSGWEGHENVAQNIYIGKVEEDGTIKERHIISKPTYEWEKAGTEPHVPEGINEGPQFFKRSSELADAGNLWRLDSAGASWTDHYCLSLSLYTGGDPLEMSSWEKMSEPIFQSTDDVFGPGHACVIQSKDERWWLIYHKARHSGSGWDRVACAQEITWDSDGTPNFGTPLSVSKDDQIVPEQIPSSPRSTTL